MTAHTHAPPVSTADRPVALIGHSNVGKSALFQRLTGVYTPVSNYPGTTVEVARGQSSADPDLAIIDTPGVVTLPSTTEDERVTARILLEEPLQGIIQVGDAKNLRRTLLLTVILREMHVPMVLALNMRDEADHRGIRIDADALSQRLGIKAIPTVAIRGEGTDGLIQALADPTGPRSLVSYGDALETAIRQISELLPASPISDRALALLWLAGDSVVADWLERSVPRDDLNRLGDLRTETQLRFTEPLGAAIQEERLAFIDELLPAVREAVPTAHGLAEALGRLATHPIAGLPVLALVLYGLYLFVGVFGAGTLVDFLEGQVFEGVINPIAISWATRLAPWPWLADFLVGEFGLWTMGMTYALALILPIVTTFFLAFGLLEDSGYLPRLSVLTNRTFRTMGLNGRAVLPMILGLGCVTMATVTTRVLESKRDRFLVILLLALAVPCSAQLGVVMGLLASISLGATVLWGLVVLGVLLAVGALAARLLPGQSSPLLLELPPLRLPGLSNIIAKTLARLEWYMREVIPVFLFGTAIMFFLDRFGALDWIIRAGEPLVTGWLRLPPEAGAAFVMGFLRRDFGATGLFVMASAGSLTPPQIVVAMVTVTLFVPCVAAALMMARERGWRTAAAVVAVVFPLAFLVGGLLSRLLALTGWAA